MRLTVLVLFTATVLLHGVSGHLFPRAIPHVLTKKMELTKDYKRQSDIAQCVNDRIDAAFPGNDSDFVSDCRYSAREEFELIDLPDIPDLQSIINSVFRPFCIPECGNVIIDAYNDCGYFELIGLSGVDDFLIGLCGTNQNGDFCYERYGDAIDLVSSEESCYGDYLATDECNCRSVLLDGVEEQGCCLDAYHDFFNDNDGFVKADELYDACNVDLPTGCNNSPITAGSGVITQVAPLVTLISALIFSVVLG